MLPVNKNSSYIMLLYNFIWVAGASTTAHAITTSVSSCRDRLDNCVAYGISVCTDPLYVAWASDNCMAFCNLCPQCMFKKYFSF